ncbi:GH92 family glycosyl hydrolase [Luteococcus sp. Sow4_B9]|uniref:GH92 family glycosyl hydrolase n=1 Tax=Luteococcus sp. Sow4_B9 TaxID=3438792 RepID=UPI003F9D5EAD
MAVAPARAAATVVSRAVRGPVCSNGVVMPVAVEDAGPPDPPSSAPRTGLVPDEPVLRIDLDSAGQASLAELAAPAPGDLLRIAIHCETDGDDFAATRVWPAVKTNARTHRLADQHGHRPDADAPVTCLVAEQWNLLECPLPHDAVTTEPLHLVLDCPQGRGRVWVQLLGVAAPPPDPQSPVEHVRTTRGTHSGPRMSRGNTLPATCLPHGGVLLTPVTDARTHRWIYQWHPPGGLALEALAISHQPSPWIGERGAVQVMPWQGLPHVAPGDRRIAFRHDDEYDRPHHYRVRLADDSTAEMVPTLHGGMMRFTFPDDHGSAAGQSGVILDMPGHGRWWSRPLPDGRLAVWARIEPEPAFGRRRRDPVTFCYGETRQSASVLPQRWPRRRQAMVLRHEGRGVLELTLATSHISVDQARHSLTIETQSASFDELRDRARQTWDELLGRLELPSATRQQRTTAWSNLYRLHCWPMAFHENAGTVQEPRWVHASPFAPASDLQRWRTPATHTHLPVLPGELYVNNGFWDTYRTCWPALGLFFPDLAGGLVDGLLPAFRESGWMGRWTAPGHVDSMVGTSSDVILADAAVHGLAFDEVTAHASALRNASCPPPDVTVGRKGIGEARFLGWVPSEVQEGFSWSIENSICDAALARWSHRLAQRAQGARCAELMAQAYWLVNRALAVQQLFDPGTGFLRGRRRDGRWSSSHHDPLRWGGDHTESTAWTMSASLPHDGALLAQLHGGMEQDPAAGERALAAHLDALFKTPERADRPGGYRRVIHEMREARALRMGQCALSNQPAHHLPFMHLHAGQPWRSQQIVRELLDRAFVGDEIGQGHPGDEDNGEMSAWWLLAASGLFPLAPGSGEYVLGAPLLPTTWHRPHGALRVTTSGRGQHVAAVRIDGRAWESVTVPVECLQGEVHLHVELSEQPAGWGTASHPSSLSTGALAREWGGWRPDRSAEADWAHRSLVDDIGDHPVCLPPGSVLRGEWAAAWSARLVTVTAADAAEVLVRVRRVGGWEDQAQRLPAARWPGQTVPSLLANWPAPVDAIELVLPGGGRLLQVEVY